MDEQKKTVPQSYYIGIFIVLLGLAMSRHPEIWAEFKSYWPF